jgi:hypothetical protein
MIIRHLGHWTLVNLALRDLECLQKGIRPGNDLSSSIAWVSDGMAARNLTSRLKLLRVYSALRVISRIGAASRTCERAACSLIAVAA